VQVKEEAMKKQVEDIETKTASAVEELKAQANHVITLSSGVVLRGRQVPPLTLIKIMAKFQRPDPPIYHSEIMGRDVENPDDPDYIARVQAYQTQSSNAMLNALIILGTELVSVPKKFPKPDDDEWLEQYNELGLGDAKPKNESWRYLTWMTFKAVLDEKDLELIRDAVGRLSGVPESTVKSAEDFPGSDQKSR